MSVRGAAWLSWEPVKELTAPMGGLLLSSSVVKVGMRAGLPMQVPLWKEKGMGTSHDSRL